MEKMKEFIVNAGTQADAKFEELCQSRNYAEKVKKAIEQAIEIGVRKAYYHQQCSDNYAASFVRYLNSIGCHNVKNYHNYAWHYFEFEF